MSFFKLSQFEDLDPRLEQELADAEEQANKKDLADVLEKRYGAASGKQPWLTRNIGARRSAYLFSFFCNLLSIAAGWYGALIVMEIVPIPYLNYVCAALCLIGMEKYKRQFSDSFWDTYFSRKLIRWDLALKNFSLLAISLFLSVFGMYFAVNDFSPEAKQLGLSDSPEAAAMQDRVRVIDSTLLAIREDQSNYNSQGQFYHIHAKKENALTEERTSLTRVLEAEHGVIIVANENLMETWNLKVGFRSYFGVIITLLAELVFEICMAFCSYYDFRLYRALKVKRRGEVNGVRKKSPAPVVY